MTHNVMHTINAIAPPTLAKITIMEFGPAVEHALRVWHEPHHMQRSDQLQSVGELMAEHGHKEADVQRPLHHVHDEPKLPHSARVVGQTPHGVP
jgi:hypothetical protein